MSATSGGVCDCLRIIHDQCPGTLIRKEAFVQEGEIGRVGYTIAMLLMFSFVIVLLMFRSIRRSSSTIEMEALLDAMRFREELDIQQRQRRRLMKAKNKVTAWLSKNSNGNGRLWQSSPQLVPTRRQTSYGVSLISETLSRSTTSDLPEIVVTDEGLAAGPSYRSRTPALSLIYDFGEDSLSRRASSLSGLHESMDSARASPALTPPMRQRPSIASIASQRSLGTTGSLSVDMEIPLPDSHKSSVVSDNIFS